MAPTKVILLACGSFNPITNMHMRMFEIARDYLHRMGQHVVIGGLISPVHDGYGKSELESTTHRLALIKLALQNTDWIKLSDWECTQETWSRTRQVLQYHQNHVNALLHSSINNKRNEDNVNWIPDQEIKTGDVVQVKLLCGADLLESFGTPGLWSDDDIEAIIGHHGLVVITRSSTNPLEFIYRSDILTKYMSNIVLVTEWIRNEVSSTKIRRALRRSESVKYLLPDKVIEYILKHRLYGSKSNNKYLSPFEYNNYNFLTPSPTDDSMESPSSNNCMIICNNALFSRSYDKLSIDSVDGVHNKNINTLKHPGQAVKIVTQVSGDHKVVKDGPNKKEVGTVATTAKKAPAVTLKPSKSCTNFGEEVKSSERKAQARSPAPSGGGLKECKSCDENLIKFIFTKHGIQVISDVETIV